MLSHVVILGAGATIAAIPIGDKNGIKSPAMNDFFIRTHMEHLLDDFEIKTTSTNLEDIYSELYENPKYKDKLGVLDDAIYDYFSKLKLPDEPTIYDLLVLGLTKDDLIATFNWDPLLIQAYERCYLITDNLPKMAFLHGNVALGYCPDCLDYGDVDNDCPTCGKKFVLRNGKISFIHTTTVILKASMIAIQLCSQEEVVKLNLPHTTGIYRTEQIQALSKGFLLRI